MRYRLNNYNYDMFFDIIDGKISNSHSFDNLPYDIRNLILTYYELYIGQIDISIKSKFFELIKYCLEGKTLDCAVNFKTTKDSEFLKISDKEKLKFANEQDAQILKEIYKKYKNNESEWNIFKQHIKNYSFI